MEGLDGTEVPVRDDVHVYAARRLGAGCGDIAAGVRQSMDHLETRK